MHIAVLTGGDGWHVQDLLRAAQKLGHTTDILDFRKLCSEVSCPPAHSSNGDGEETPFDAVIVRTMPPGSLEQVVFRMDMLHECESKDIPILNPPRALEVCVDKYLAIARLETAGLRVPPTIVCQQAEAALDAFEQLGGDVVVKPIFGSEGRGMVRLSDRELAWRTFRAIERTQSVFYVQRFINHPGWDVRAFVSRGRVLTAMRRIANGDWRTNVAQGGCAEALKLTPKLKSMALRASEAVGTIIAGVDLLPGPDGEWYVVEVNAVPGWKALAKVTGVDVAAEMIQAVCP